MSKLGVGFDFNERNWKIYNNVLSAKKLADNSLIVAVLYRRALQDSVELPMDRDPWGAVKAAVVSPNE